jgi:ribonuclease P/MRP protein subunit RPP40
MQLKPSISRLIGAVPPFVHDEQTLQDQLYEEQLLEWLGLVTLSSPRISECENIDRYLCKYALPEAFEDESKKPQSLVHIRWHGFASNIFIRHIWLILSHATRERDDPWYAAERKGLDEKGVTWFSLSARTFEDTSFTALCNDHKSVLLWECD